MTVEDFERAQELRDARARSYDMLCLMENYKGCKHISKGEIVYRIENEDINTSSPPDDLCDELISVVNRYIDKLDEEFSNL